MDGLISIEEFFNTKLKAAKVLAAEKVEGADKLLKLTLDAGESTPRTVVSGIAQHYTPDRLIGKTVVLVANLKPAKLRGIVSEGMILCASEGDAVIIVSPESAVAAGAQIS